MEDNIPESLICKFTFNLKFFMKRFFLFLIGSLLIVSCQEKETISMSEDNNVELDSESAKQEFAVILSKERHNGVDGYRIKEIDTGFIYMLIMPRYE